NRLFSSGFIRSSEAKASRNRVKSGVRTQHPTQHFCRWTEDENSVEFRSTWPGRSSRSSACGGRPGCTTKRHHATSKEQLRRSHCPRPTPGKRRPAATPAKAVRSLRLLAVDAPQLAGHVGSDVRRPLPEDGQAGGVLAQTSHA